ncbi:MAG: MFS transporter [Candidatus Levybacteria bacterium]|nr:MFS transporter [Candidatus Levybacteria bacterium]
MIKEIFIGRKPSDFHMNGVVKAFIISEIFLWSSWNAIIPIFAIFAATKIPGGSTEIAASSFSCYLIVRVIFELISGRYLSKSKEMKKFIISIAGIILISIGYLGFAMTTSVTSIFIFYSVIGMGLGIATPAKNSLFSMHLDKNKEVTEWSIYDGFVFMGMAMSATIGGFVASSYGFTFLFYLAATTNLLSIIPYLLYAKRRGTTEPEHLKRN